MELHPQLKKDCHQLLVSNDICVLLHRNASVPWFILVPLSNAAEFRELFELPAQMRANLDLLADQLSQYLLNEHSADKINTAAIGNLASQLHLHVIGRFKTDACWPQPVWGNLQTSDEYPNSQLLKIKSDLNTLINSLATI